MSTSGEHLSQESLSEKAMKVLDDLEGLLAGIEFTPETQNLHRCAHSTALLNVVQLLIKELDFIPTKDPVPGYNAFRIPAYQSGALDPPTIRVSTGPAYFIPVHISDGEPTVSNQPFQRGTATLVKQPVKVSPALDFLVIAPPT